LATKKKKRKAPVRKAPPKRKAPPRKAPPKRKAPVRKAPTRKATPKRKAPVRKAPTRKAPPKRKAPVRKAPTLKAPPKRKAPVRKAPTRKATPKRKAPVRKAPVRKAPKTEPPTYGKSPQTFNRGVVEREWKRKKRFEPSRADAARIAESKSRYVPVMEDFLNALAAPLAETTRVALVTNADGSVDAELYISTMGLDSDEISALITELSDQWGFAYAKARKTLPGFGAVYARMGATFVRIEGSEVKTDIPRFRGREQVILRMYRRTGDVALLWSALLEVVSSVMAFGEHRSDAIVIRLHRPSKDGEKPSY
jgi:hypothetical protein